VKKLLEAFTRLGLFTDLLILTGLAMIFYGLWLYQPWLAFTITGSLVLLIGIALQIWGRKP